MPWKDRETRLAYLRAYRFKLGMKPRISRRHASNCAGCGKPLGPRGVKYCSSQCSSDTRYREYIAHWLAGEVAGGTVALVSRHIRRYLIEQGGERCSQCAWAERNPRTGRVPLEIDHLNGNYADNSPQNIRLICPNCHALTPTFRALNKGNGRPWAIVRRNT